MGESTGIAWTDATFNAWWGCVKISPACKFCYAAEVAERGGWEVWGAKKRVGDETVDVQRRFFGDHHWNEPRRWNKRAEKAGRRLLVFCGSMMDYLEDRRDLDVHRARLKELVHETPWIDWQMLSKRPENGLRLMGEAFYKLPNVWAGATLEDREHLSRVDALRELPSSIRFLSIEPLLESLVPGLNLEGMHWVITGGESGTHLKPGSDLARDRALVHHIGGKWRVHPEREQWVRDIRDLCAIHDVAFFHKQWGGPTPKSGGHLLDGRELRMFPRGDGPLGVTLHDDSPPAAPLRTLPLFESK